MNILLTSVGRRGYLVRYFKEALGDRGLVLSANSGLLTTGMLASDKRFIVPGVDSSKYIETLLAICENNNVKLVVSLFDIDLPILAQERNRFLNIGVEVAVSDPWVIDVANDKWKTFTFLTQHGITTPKTYLTIEDAITALKNGVEDFPLTLKPRWGMGSLFIFVAENMAELEFFFQYCKKELSKSYLNILSRVDLSNSVIIQDFIDGNEYGLDVLNDFQGKHLVTVVKKKLGMRSGETDAAITVKRQDLYDVGLSLSSLLRHRGNLDVDVIIHKGKPHIIELNARFGGGYPFSHIAGANTPSALIDMADGKTPNIDSVRIGVVGLKDINPVIFNKHGKMLL